MSGSERTALLLFCVVYAFIVVPVALLPTDLVGMLMYCLYLAMSLCVALDLTEVLLSVVWGATPVLRAEGFLPRNKAAVLMVICDDSSEDCLRALLPLDQAGYSVFLLDDSELDTETLREFTGRVTHIRRNWRTGAKAGNLNNWLFQYGAEYEYAIILDSDSLMSGSCADALLAAAIHPANAHVALFQSKICSAKVVSVFGAAIGSACRPRMRILERVHTRLGLLLSAGHNVLVRLEPLRGLGGFDQTITAEDTVLSLEFASRGWGILLVDAWSEDTDPPTIGGYNRRTIRWARQTVELLQRSWPTAPYRLELLLIRHLLNYLFPILGTVMLLLSVWLGPSRPDETFIVMVSALRFAKGFESLGLAIWAGMLVTVLLLLLRLSLGMAEGVGMRKLMLAILFGSANYPTLVVPLARGMLTSAIGKRVTFLPTNGRRKIGRQSLICRGEAVLSSLFLSLIVIAGVFKHPASCLLGLTGVWLCCFLLSPLALSFTEHLSVMKHR